jgi:glycerophosphoryl diester phosphodiesterase
MAADRTSEAAAERVAERRTDRRLRRVGHKGADLIEPGNTIASFDAALLHGVDMIELDVLPVRVEGRPPGWPEAPLVIAHDYEHVPDEPLTLEAGLAHLASPAFAELELVVDLKLPGYEARVIDALVAAGLESRSLVSSTYRESLVRLRELEAPVRVGWSVPRASKDYTTSPLLKLPAYAALAVMRRTLPRRARAALGEGLCDAVMAYWRLVSPALVDAVSLTGGELYAWTVDKASQISDLERLGVTGVITNDPRLFGTAPGR